METLLLAAILVWVLISHRRAEFRRRRRMRRCRRIEGLMVKKPAFDIDLGEEFTPQKMGRIIYLSDYRGKKTGT